MVVEPDLGAPIRVLTTLDVAGVVAGGRTSLPR